MTRAAAIVALAAIGLAGCAAAPRTSVLPGVLPVDAAQVPEWTASGRLAVVAAQDGGSGAFTWQQKEARTELEVRGPLGVGALRIVSDGESLAVTDSAGRSVDTEAAREQLRTRLGTDLPIADLRYWMLGLAAPGSAARVSDTPTTPWRVIEQGGWQVSYDQFTAAQGWRLPSRLSAVSGAVRIKVLVDGWRVPPAGGVATPAP